MITMKDIIREGHPTLKIPALEVTLPVSETDKSILFSMREFLINSQNEEIAQKYELRAGVGLAAPQINISKRMLAIYANDENNNLYDYMLINPKIISHSVESTFLISGEGCLSVDREISGFVIRPKRVTIKALQLKENGDIIPITLRVKDYIAIVLQHEIDHLNGILFMDRINKDNPFYVPDDVNPIEFK
ncbi:MAG TPA: peptide deformylase [Haloplasmataceae bacterium]